MTTTLDPYGNDDITSGTLFRITGGDLAGTEVFIILRPAHQVKRENGRWERDLTHAIRLSDRRDFDLPHTTTISVIDYTNQFDA